MQIVGSGTPMERIAIDILCELPETDRDNRHIYLQCPIISQNGQKRLHYKIWRVKPVASTINNGASNCKVWCAFGNSFRSVPMLMRTIVINQDLCLPYIMMAYKSIAHETTSFSPDMLLLGEVVSPQTSVCIFGDVWKQHLKSLERTLKQKCCAERNTLTRKLHGLLMNLLKRFTFIFQRKKWMHSQIDIILDRCPFLI